MRFVPLSAAVLAATTLPALAQVVIPTDAGGDCAIDSTTFSGWFASGSASAGGMVTPTDGFDFPPSATNTKCDFYQWGAQMFLWLTSPDDGGLVFDSGLFYDVVPSGKGFEFIQSSSGAPNTFALRTTKPQDIGGTGQAGGGDVLISQAKSLTYYGIHANDIYAWYRTGFKHDAFKGMTIAKDFPTTKDDVGAIAKYAGIDFADFNASTMELKTSWVDATTVNAEDFVLIEAQIPKFNRSSDTEWTSDGTEIKQLAMVGMHIAAPVLGHPELVWISYEHINNAPMAEYVYTTSGGATATVPYSSAGKWVYLPSDAAEPGKITPNAKSKDGNIVATGAGPIAAVDDLQKNPWGVEPGAGADIVNNTDLVALNASVLGMLRGLGDVRGNYYQIGGIWTVDGQNPSGGGDGNNRGGTRLANSTLETFHQFPDVNLFPSKNCFTCHNAGADDPSVDISHIFDNLAPLK